jgi:phosphoribosylformimino-5-aminoimidazole carboxamide ribotide isomerase
VAKDLQEQGAARLHIVDLDGAKAGEPRHINVLKQIVAGVNIPVEFGGGLRTRENIAAVLSAGARWAILGTKAAENVDFVRDMVAEFGERIIVSIDVKNRKVAARGWTATTEVDDVDLIKKMQQVQVKAFVYTDISRDGTLAGSNLEGVKRVLQETGASIICSGGVSSIEDIKKLKTLEKLGLAGIIIGKALYEEKIHIAQVKRILEAK